MNDSAELHVLRVFTDADGHHGNPLGVFLDGQAIAAASRQAVAADLGFSETVFVDDARAGRIQILTPATELPFAGHPTVGTAWLLERQGQDVETLRPPAGEVPTWSDGVLRWVRARPEWIQNIEIEQLGSAAEIEALAGGPPGIGSYYPWAWIDEAAGVLRSRYFFTDAGIGEDEATGAAAVKMGALIGRPIEIRQGRGSILHVRPGPDGTVEVGGRCLLDEVRAYPLP
jgi:predicted PhzF superfamily epimerase YddE/YHI9